MLFQDIKDILVQKGYCTDAKATQQDLYTVIDKKQLFSGSNRLNSGWARGKYVIAKDDASLFSIDQYLEQWKQKTKGYQDQILCLEVTAQNWHFYNNIGVEINFNVQPPQLKPNRTENASLLGHLNHNDIHINILHALRAKPFLLLAGISGTGKSRIVRELAFKSCPIDFPGNDKTTPGNYCMVEVKPNWHDSTELLGYYSNISKSYQFTKFVKFLIKAMMFPNIPFFVCLDEMNLAPVEQYFAEYLSVLETRKKVFVNDADSKCDIQSGTLVDRKYFKELNLGQCKTNGDVYTKLFECSSEGLDSEICNDKSLIERGLTIPKNVFVIGTVNMDDTTHQFSRKVIDRAMTIEMNGCNFMEMFGHSNDLDYQSDNIWTLDKFSSNYVTADEALDNHPDEAEQLKSDLVGRLEAINEALANTPFQISFRVLNELCIYTAILLDDGMEVGDAKSHAVDMITLMKILPRIEGDEDMFAVRDGSNKNRLEKLMDCLANCPESCKKLEEMNARLKNGSGFTRFWP